MSTVAKENLENKVNDLQELKRMREELEAEISAIEDELKAYMTDAALDSFTAGAFKVTWKEVIQNRLDTTAMKKAFPAETLAPYTKTIVTRPFKVA